jgi:hypothetical protein
LPHALGAAEARHVAPRARLEPSARAAADAARRDHLALVGVLVEQLECAEAKLLVLSLLALHDSRQQLGPCARVCRHALVDWDVPDEHPGQGHLRRWKTLVGCEAVIAGGLDVV